MARPKRFELLTPRFVVWCSIGRVLDSRLIPDDGSPPRNETMRHEPDRHSPALDFKSSRLNRMCTDTLVVACRVNAREIETLGSYVVAAFALPATPGEIRTHDLCLRRATSRTGTSCERPSSNRLAASTCLNSRKDKDKSERVVTFVRLPGMYEAGPRYH